MTINIRELDHVVIRARDMERMAAFYQDVLGCSLVRELPEDIQMVQLQAGRSMIDIVSVSGRIGRKGGAAPGREGRNMDHLCFRIEPFDEATIRAYLADHGVEAGETADRMGAEGFGPSIYISDPEGNVVELKGPPTR